MVVGKKNRVCKLKKPVYVYFKIFISGGGGGGSSRNRYMCTSKILISDGGGGGSYI